MNQIFAPLLLQSHENSSNTLHAKAPLFVELLTYEAQKQRPILLITKNKENFATRLKNLRFFNGPQKTIILSLPSDERTVMHATSADPLMRMEQVATRFRLSIGSIPNILIATPESLLEKCAKTADLQKHTQLIARNEKIDREKFIYSLNLLGYSKVSHVLDKGTFAVRGSIIDIFVNGEKKPIRIDLFGDEIESIKYFDENTQRSFDNIDSIIIGGAKEIFFDKDTIAHAHERLTELSDIINYPTQKLNEKLRDIDNGIHFYGMEKLCPAFFDNLSSPLELILEIKEKRPLIIFDDKEAILNEVTSFLNKIKELYDQAFIRNDLIFFKEEYFLSKESLENLLSQFPSIDISPSYNNKPSFLCHDTTDIRHDILKESISVNKDEEPHLLKPLAKRIKNLHREALGIVIVVSSHEHELELKKLLEPFGINIASLKSLPAFEQLDKLFKPHIHAYTLTTKHPLAFGAIFDFLNFALIAEDDIFGKRTKRKDISGKQKGFSTSISDLELNDLVVHVDHGVGQFKGLVRLNVRGVENDYILLIYANEEKLYLPTHRINLLKPHGAHLDGTIRLDKLGNNAWESKKKKVKAAVMAMAQDLLKLYAKREIVERPPFIAPDAHFFEFEANFEFETTHDQQKAIDDVIADLQKKRPMDRLVCGDVGYGKTEVAMRAAMLSVLSNRQVAVLAPTTVLAQQHGINFKERFKNTGINIAVLSRFQNTQEIKKVIDNIKKNKADIVIGTHRLLSPDVDFHNLGLIIIDEEQRFGIKAKEHLKKMRTMVDVLTMSATPIPRTLQMSYFGIRDLSIIETPPVDRRAIETQVTQFDDAVIKEAIMRELSRGGQVYFVHNRVQSIETIAHYVRSLAPEARVAVAHGQMNEKDLEDIMLKFMAHEINLLVCTTIIETGIDVPTANTMFINDADDFGLSQLYQLRGRIGRSKERAFAFLLIKEKTEHLTPIAKARLEILHKFSELGAGFRIAQHDLELRGAGDLLGKNQHGHMATVGYDLYAELLQEAVKELQGQTQDEAIEPEVILPMSALISDKYCPDLHERMAFYQRLASANSKEKIESIILDLEDLYGEAPKEVMALKASALIKLLLKKIYATRLELVHGKDENSFVISINLSPRSPINQEKLITTIKEGSMRITPQNKVMQTLTAINDLSPDMALQISIEAIANIKNTLLTP